MTLTPIHSQRHRQGFYKMRNPLSILIKKLKNTTLRKILVFVSRLVVGLLCLISGYESIVDPVGSNILCDRYIHCLGLDILLPLSYIISICISSLQFVIGVCMTLGAKIKWTSIMATIFVTVQIIASTITLHRCPDLYDGINHTISAHKIGSSLAHNIILLGLASLIFHWRNYNIGFYTKRTEWLISIYGFAFSVVIAIHCYFSLPILDLTICKEGESITKVIDYAEDHKIELDDETKASMLHNGYSFILVSPDITQASTTYRKKLNKLYSYCLVNNYNFAMLTTAEPNSREIEEYIIETSGAEYPFFQIKRELTDAFVRSNPELFLLEDGIVKTKYSCYQIPTFPKPLEEVFANETEFPNEWNGVYKSILYFVAPLLIILIYDYLIELIKLLYRYWKKKRNKGSDEDSKPETEEDGK